MIRKINILLLWICLVGQIIAAPVDAKRAKAFARQFIQLDEEDFRSAKLEPAPAYYLFNAKEGKGFVLVSGDDRLPLLMGYADEGHLDREHLPIQLKALLKRYEALLKNLNKETARTDAFRSQKAFIPNPKVIVAPLMKSQWGQAEPFNNNAPEITDGVQAVSGCVATAMAQLMYYHQWPKEGQGSHSYTTNSYRKKLSANFKNHRYRWSEMRATYPIKRYWLDAAQTQIRIERLYKENEASAVAELMYDVAVAVDMDFQSDVDGGSSTTTNKAAVALKKYFKYKTKFLSRMNFTGSDFMDKLKSELRASRPFILSGAKLIGNNASVGHAWVVDGYDENDFLHCNWGWEGIANGFYSINLLKPDQLGIGANFGEYNDFQDVVLAEPNKNNSPEIREPATLSCIGNGYMAYRSPDVEQRYRAIKLDLISVGNNGSVSSFYGQLGIGAYNQNNKLVKTSFELPRIHNLQETSYYEKISLTLWLNDLPEGKYKICPISKYEKEAWRPFKKANEVYVEIKGGQVHKLSDTHQLAFELQSPPREINQLYRHKEGSSYISIKNLSTRIIEEANIRIRLRSKFDKEKHIITLMPVRFFSLETMNYRVRYNLNSLPPVKAGAYEVDFIIRYENQDYPVKNPFGTYTINILDNRGVADLNCEGLAIAKNGQPLLDYHLNEETLKGQFNFLTRLRNEGSSSFKGHFIYRLKKIEDGSLIDLGQTEELELARGGLTPDDKMAVNVELSKLKLSLGLYELHLIAKNEAGELDVWNPSFERPIFVYEIAKATALGELRAEPVRVYPNPVANVLKLEGAFEEVSLYSLKGERLRQLRQQGRGGVESLDLSDLAQGLYILRLRTAEGEKSLRIYKK